MSAPHTLSPFERLPREVRFMIYPMIQGCVVPVQGRKRLRKGSGKGWRKISGNGSGKELYQAFLAERDDLRKPVNVWTVVTMSQVSSVFRADMEYYRVGDLRGLAAAVHNSIVIFANLRALKVFARQNQAIAQHVRAVCLARFDPDDDLELSLCMKRPWPFNPTVKAQIEDWCRNYYPALTNAALTVDPLPRSLERENQYAMIPQMERWLTGWSRRRWMGDRPLAQGVPDVMIFKIRLPEFRSPAAITEQSRMRAAQQAARFQSLFSFDIVGAFKSVPKKNHSVLATHLVGTDGDSCKLDTMSCNLRNRYTPQELVDRVAQL